MSTVVMHAVTSVDGYIADENDEVGPLFDWYFNGDQAIVGEPAEVGKEGVLHHIAVTRAIRERDPSAASEAMQAHLAYLAAHSI